MTERTSALLTDCFVTPCHAFVRSTLKPCLTFVLCLCPYCYNLLSLVPSILPVSFYSFLTPWESLLTQSALHAHNDCLGNSKPCLTNSIFSKGLKENDFLSGTGNVHQTQWQVCCFGVGSLKRGQHEAVHRLNKGNAQ